MRFITLVNSFFMSLWFKSSQVFSHTAWCSICKSWSKIDYEAGHDSDEASL